MTRRVAAGRVLVLVLTALLAVVAGPPAPGRGEAPPALAPADAAVMEETVVARVNAVRQAHGVGALAPDSTLGRLAREHSCRMAGKDFFSHAEPAGGDLPSRVGAAALTFEMVGENIARTAGTDDPVEAAVQGWMESAGHRRNILEPAFTRTGVGICLEEDSAYFTQIFLRPRR